MLKVIALERGHESENVADAHNAWKRKDVKIIHFKSVFVNADDTTAFYEKLLPKLGTVHFLAESVLAGGRDEQRTNEIWTDVRYDPTFTDAYRHSLNAQPLHTDGSYIPSYPNSTLMYCLANAAHGGETVFLNFEDFIGALRQESPELLSALLEVKIPHARSGDSRTSHVIELVDGIDKVYWNYYCVDKAASPKVQEIADQLFNFLTTSELIKEKLAPVKLAPGDAIVWKDDEILHGRNSFSATEASERFLRKCALDFGKFSV